MGLKTGKGSWDPPLVQPDECEGSSGGERWARECGCLAPGAGPRPTVPGEWPSGQLASFVPTTESRCWRSQRVPWSLGQPSLGGESGLISAPPPLLWGAVGTRRLFAGFSLLRGLTTGPGARTTPLPSAPLPARSLRPPWRGPRLAARGHSVPVSQPPLVVGLSARPGWPSSARDADRLLLCAAVPPPPLNFPFIQWDPSATDFV